MGVRVLACDPGLKGGVGDPARDSVLITKAAIPGSSHPPMKAADKVFRNRLPFYAGIQ